MSKAKERRAHDDFMKALQAQAENHALSAIEFLSSEIEALNKLFEQHNFGIGISGKWVMKNMSYTVEMCNNLSGREASLLRMMFTPLTSTELHMVVQHEMHNEREVLRSYEPYQKLNEQQALDRLNDSIRKHIEGALPTKTRNLLKGIIHDSDGLEITSEQIVEKYGVAIPKDNKQGKAPFDPIAAYKLALYHQEQGNVGAYGRIPSSRALHRA